MRQSVFVLLACLVLLPASGEITWNEIRKKPEFVIAKKQIADFLPDLAIPRIEKLLELPELDSTARASLLTLLGEALVRAGRSGEALKILDDPALREFSPAHLWRSHALTQLGRYLDAIGELAKIDRPAMRPAADLQTAKLHLALNNLEQARPILEPLLDSSDPKLVREATLQLVSVALAQNRTEDAEALLQSFAPANPVEENLKRYLKGQLHLARSNRLAAIGTFQSLREDDPEIRKNLPAALFHESSLALADSLALEGNEEAAVAFILETLEKDPDGPKLDLLFLRLRQWSDQIPPGPLLEKLAEWVPRFPAPNLFSVLPGGDSLAGLSATPSLPEATPRGLLALEFLATQNLRSSSASRQERGRLQVSLLQFLIPPDALPLGRSLLELGLRDLKSGNHQQALATFLILSESQNSAQVRARSKGLAGQAAFALEQPTRASQFYREAEAIAADLRRDHFAAVAALNAGLTLLPTSNSRDLDQITVNLSQPEIRAELVLERGLSLASRQKISARAILANFLTYFSDHSRAPEAALALAESAVFTPPFDRELATTQLASLRFTPRNEPLLEGRRVLVLLALGTNLRQAHDLLARYPDHPFADRILFQLGQAYRNPDRDAQKEIGKANFQFELLLDQYPDSIFAEAARFYSALTSVALKTESADEKALSRFREVIEADGVLADEAAIHLCRFLIDRNQQEEALQTVAGFLEKTDLLPPDRQRFLILGAEAANQIGQHEKALTFYDQLLKMDDLPVAARNRASFIRGQALEKLGRTVEALATYHTVVNRNFDPAATNSLEWKWFDKCGIEGALALLEKEERWEAAIQLAEKIGASGSPRAQDAREIADRLALEHFIYRQRPAPGSEPGESGE